MFQANVTITAVYQNSSGALYCLMYKLYGTHIVLVKYTHKCVVCEGYCHII